MREKPVMYLMYSSQNDRMIALRQCSVRRLGDARLSEWTTQLRSLQLDFVVNVTPVASIMSVILRHLPYRPQC